MNRVVLGLDPGFVNSGWALIEVNDGNRIRVQGCGLLKNPPQDFKNLGQSIRRFEQEVSALLEGTTGLAVERWVGRNFTPKGKNPESISFQVALACSLQAARGYPVTLLTSAQWKNEFRRQVGTPIDGFYKRCRAPAHPLDAVMQAAYADHQLRGMTQERVSRLVGQVERRWLAGGGTLRKTRG